MKELSLKTRLKIGYVILILVAVCLLIHSQYSFCFTDESFYSALVHRLWVGDKLITDEWHPVQFYAPILLPFYSLFRFFNGSSDGVILYFRIIHILFTLLVSIYLYKVCCKKYSVSASLIASLFCILYSRANINGPSYYNICFLMFLLSLLLIYQGFNTYKNEKIYGVISGVIISGAVLCNPYLSLFIVPAIILFLLIKNKIIILKSHCAGIVISAILYLCFMLYKNNISAFANCFKYILNDSQHTESLGDKTYAFVIKVYNFIIQNPKLIIVALGCLIIALITIFLLVYYKKGKIYKVIVSFIPLLWIIYLVVGLVIFKNSFLNSKTSVCYIVTFSFTVYVFPIITFHIFKRKSQFTSALYISGILMAISFAAGSNTGIDAMTTGFCICSIAGVFALYDFYKDMQSIETYMSKFLQIVFIVVITIILIGMLLIFSAHRFLGIYRDAEITKLNTLIIDGPAKHLYTTEEHAYQYNSLLEIAEETSELFSDKKVLITKRCPWMYLCFDYKYGSYTGWTVAMDNPHLLAYYKNFSDKIADIVFLLDERVGTYETAPFNNHTGVRKANINNIDNDFYKYMITEYELWKETEFAKVYIKKETS